MSPYYQIFTNLTRLFGINQATGVYTYLDWKNYPGNTIMISHVEQGSQLVHDSNHRHPTFGGRTVGCRIRIIEQRWNTIVIATDTNETPFSSIMLHTDELATTICGLLKLNADRLIWIEHIPADPELGRSEDLFDLVHFDSENGYFTRPQWTPLTVEEVGLLTDGLWTEPAA